MAYAHLDSGAMRGRQMAYAVYTPPHWSSGERLPLFVFLHGGGGDTVRCLEEAGIATLLDEEIDAGRLPRIIVAVPQGDRGFWANWADGTRRYEDWVLREVMPAVARDYSTLSCPEGCNVMGVSMGGNGALRFTLDHPELFRSVSILSGPIFDRHGMEAMMHNWFYRYVARLDRVFGSITNEDRMSRADPFQRWRSPEDVGRLRIFFARGTQDRDGIAATNDAFRDHLVQCGIRHRYVVFNGGHRWEDWKPLFPEAIRYVLGTD
jgi:enterochelin esterase-like enzyme